MRIRRAFQALSKLASTRARHTRFGRTLAQIEIRELGAQELSAFAQAVRTGFSELERVRAVQVLPELRRVIVKYDDEAYTAAELMRVVEAAERSISVHLAPFSDDGWEHPADQETIERLLAGLAADTIGIAVGLGLRFSPIPASKLLGTLASVLTIAQTSPRARSIVDERLGTTRAELALGTFASLAHGFSQRPGSAWVDFVHKFSQLGPVRARQRVWEEREPELLENLEASEASFSPVEPRPRPLPRGPIEEYAERAWIVSLGGFALSFVATRSMQRAVAALFGGLPKPARHGREAFLSHLESQLAARSVLVIDRRALGRMDRIDCVVLEGRLVARDRYEVRRVLCAADVDQTEALQQVRELFQTARPLERQQANGHTLEPLGASARTLGTDLEPYRSELGERGELVLALSRGERVLALAEVEWIAQTGIEELVAAAREAQMRVVIASNDETILNGLSADDTISDSEGMARGIRRLQREGRGVCVVAGGDNPGLQAADCAIGLLREGERAPWGAHVICGEDLSDVRFLIFAAVAARKIAKQSVNLALGAATVGALVSAGGVLPLTGRRVIAVVNAASLISMANGYRGGIALSRRALPPPRDRTPWHALDARGVLQKLGTSERGLTQAEAGGRRPRADTGRSPVVEFLEAVTDELFNPLAPLLAAGAGLSAAVGSLGDAGMVGGVVALNAVVGGAQRYRTEKAIRDLGRINRRRVEVRRGGRIVLLDVRELVRGDVVLLSTGDVVPADCRVLESESLEVDSSSMTGESLPVRKNARPSFDPNVADRSSMIYEGTVVAAGRATAVVVAAGEDTEARRGAVAHKRDSSRGGVERRLRSLIELTGPLALGAGVGLIGAGLLRGRKLEDLVGSGVSLAVAAVPEGLPLLATAAQTAAAFRLAKQGALVRNVHCIEALGRVDVICLDKTGTLTEGRIELDLLSDGQAAFRRSEWGSSEHSVLAAALRASAAPGAMRDPTDAALGRAAEVAGVRADREVPGWTRGVELPYGAGRGYHATLGELGPTRLLSVKGAPEVVLGFSTDWRVRGERQPIDTATAAAINRHASELGRRGYRVLGIAERSEADPNLALEPRAPSGLEFLGLVGFRDPVRPSAAGAVRELSTTGVRTVMVTGDHASTASAVAEEVGLLRGLSVMTGSELSELTDEQLDRRIDGVAVFARVTPSLKVRVVRALQRRGHVVAMVGDGANDAPAIRLSNVGIAVGQHSTTAAQAAADILLTDERIESLAHAIWEGRAMWASVRDAVSILVGGNLGEIGFTLGAGLIDGRPPLSARQLLLVNLLTDVAPAMAIALQPPSIDSLHGLSREGPERSLGQPLNRDIVARALVTTLGASSAWLGARFIGGRARAGTVGLVALVGTQLGQTLVSGRFNRAVVATSLVSTAALAAIIQTPGLSHAFGCRPLGPIGWATALGASAAATAAASNFPGWIDEAVRRFGLNRPLFVEDLESPVSLTGAKGAFGEQEMLEEPS